MIIDGQQRLTTFLTLLHACGAIPAGSTSIIGGTIFPKLIAGTPAEDAAIRRGLGLSALPCPVGKTPASQRIDQAFAHMTGRVAAGGTIPVGCLQRNVKVLGICLDQKFGLGSFLTLNDRGLSLTTLEKLKAHCMYLDSLSLAPNPATVHAAFGALYRSIEDANSLINNEQAVQIATLFHINGVFRTTDVVWWSAEQCFNKALSDTSSPAALLVGNLGLFLQTIQDIAKANNSLVAALTTSSTRDIFHLVLKQKSLSHRGLAIIMRFYSQFPAIQPAIGSPSYPIPLPSNVDIANELSTQLAQLIARGCGLPSYQANIQAAIAALSHMAQRNVSVLELAVMVDNCGVRPATFLDTWRQAFAPAATIPNAFDEWADYLNWWNARYRYLRDLTDPGDCGRNSLRYKVALLKEASQPLPRYWTGGGDEVEHVFAVNIATHTPYGFPHPAAYQAFCQTLGNIVPLDGDLNKSLGANPPHVKASYYTMNRPGFRGGPVV
jgi:hypothetical protein